MSKEKSPRVKSPAISKKFAAIIGVFPVIGISILYMTLIQHATYPEIDQIQCNQMEQAVFHIHAHLDIYVDGQHRTVPALIGIIPNSCLYWLHTHDVTGIIHIESPEYRTFTLGQFMDIWSRSFEKSGIPDGTPKAYVNGNEFGEDYRSIQLKAHDEIILVYGIQPPVIPSSFEFPQGL